jgi:predicted RNase H-like nuclease
VAKPRAKHIFVGLDLAWNIDGNHSGIAVLVGDQREVQLKAVSQNVASQRGVRAFLEAHAAENTVLAVDCSLVVNNRKGQRPCETAIARSFGVYHAACHTTNTGRPYWNTGPNLVKALATKGFLHDFDLERAKRRAGRWLFEVYPHPAMVRLFGLARIIRYKKGSVAEKKAGLAKLRGYLGKLPGLQWNPGLAGLLGHDLDVLKGEALKRHEDTLDALFCAYLAWHCWKWGQERNEMFGTLQEGYIVVPRAKGRR